MKIVRLLSVFVLCVALTGCYTTGLSSSDYRGNGYRNLVHGYVVHKPKLPSETESTQVNYPIRLAVAQVGELAPPSELSDALEVQRGLIKEVIELPLDVSDIRRHNPQDMLNNQDKQFSERVKLLLRLAEMQKADQVLILGGKVESRTLGNASEFLNILILPCFIVPSQKIEVDVHVSGMLLDVSTGNVIHMINSKASDSAYRASAYVDQTRTTLAKKLMPEIVKEIAGEVHEFALK